MQVEQEKITDDDIKEYLTLYLGEADWDRHLKEIWEKRYNVKGRYPPNDPDKPAAVQFKNHVMGTIMVAKRDKRTVSQPPETLLRSITGFHQFKDKLWWEQDFHELVAQDRKIKNVYRGKALALGVIHPLEYSPITRQAFNWTFGMAKDTDVVTEENKNDIIKRFQNLVLAYGGAVICNIFMKHENNVKRVHNWRTGYFFEREIFEVYNIDQVLKIKQAELKKASPKLVKQVKL